MSNTATPSPATSTTDRAAKAEAARARKIATGLNTLARAASRLMGANDAEIIRVFTARGIAPEAISPRENTFTYNAWLALGRQVRKGEKGAKITVIIPGQEDLGTDRKFRTATIFHISQTDPATK